MLYMNVVTNITTILPNTKNPNLSTRRNTMIRKKDMTTFLFTQN